MTPSEAKQKYGATHYSTMVDGRTPQMFYKKHRVDYSDGSSATVWMYLSFCQLWQPSTFMVDQVASKLVEIETDMWRNV